MSYTTSENEAGATIGRNMMFADGIGFATPEAKTAAEALTSAGLDFKVEARPTFFQSHGSFVQDPTRRTIVRTDTEAPLGNVGSRYTIIQNSDMFDFCDRLVDDYGAKYESAWSLKGGSEVGLTMKFPQSLLIGGEDPIDKYLLLRGRHDGKGSVLAMDTAVRMRCTNMLNVAMKAATHTLRIPHLTNATQKLAAARDTLEITFKYDEVFELEMNKLLDQQITDDAFAEMTKGLLLGAHFGGVEAHTKAIVQLRKDSPTLDDDMRSTKYGALQALTEWTDWSREAKSAQGRVIDMLDGRVVKMKNAAFEALRV